MARGWESKEVESQIEAAEQRRSRPAPEMRTEAQLAAEARKSALEWERTRIQNEIAAARHPRHRAMLESALRHLEQQLAHESPEEL